jgi:hypothetical protein
VRKRGGWKKIFILLVVLVILAYAGGCRLYKTENGLVFGIPDYEKRDIHVSQVDLDILIKADELLPNENAWRRGRVSDCSQSKRLDLYCALETASVVVMGKYVHRQPALQEVRFAIDDDYKYRWDKHRLVDFNLHSDTSFADIKHVLNVAISTVKQKITHNKTN